MSPWKRLAQITLLAAEENAPNGIAGGCAIAKQEGMEIIGIGTDIVECTRIGKMIERHGEYFLQRVFTPSEIQYCHAHKSAIERFAGRWAAKEAILKALGTGWIRGISWLDVEVRNAPGGKPFVALGGGAKEQSVRSNIADILISISHCRSYATAFAIAVAKPETESEPSQGDLPSSF